MNPQDPNTAAPFDPNQQPAAPAPPAPVPDPQPMPAAPAQPTPQVIVPTVSVEPQPAQPSAPQPIAMPNVYPQPVQGGMPQMAPPPMPGKSKKKFIIIGVTAVVLIAAAVAAFMFLSKAPKVDKDTFLKNFKTCTKSYYAEAAHTEDVGDKIPDSTVVINGKRSGGCSVTMKIGKVTGTAEEQKFSNTEMTCTLDNTQDFDESIDLAFQDTSKYHCTGSLVTALDQLKQELESEDNSSL